MGAVAVVSVIVLFVVLNSPAGRRRLHHYFEGRRATKEDYWNAMYGDALSPNYRYAWMYREDLLPTPRQQGMGKSAWLGAMLIVLGIFMVPFVMVAFVLTSPPLLFALIGLLILLPSVFVTWWWVRAVVGVAAQPGMRKVGAARRGWLRRSGRGYETITGEQTLLTTLIDIHHRLVNHTHPAGSLFKPERLNRSLAVLEDAKSAVDVLKKEHDARLREILCRTGLEENQGIPEPLGVAGGGGNLVDWISRVAEEDRAILPAIAALDREHGQKFVDLYRYKVLTHETRWLMNRLGKVMPRSP
jgi:hypothetical protein